MTDYIKIHGVRKRDFTVQVILPKNSETAMTRVNADDIRVTRSGDTRVTRNGDTRIAHNVTLNVYPRIFGTVKKRSFVIQAKVNHG